MNGNQEWEETEQFKSWLKEHWQTLPLATLVILGILLVMGIILGYWLEWAWTGLRETPVSEDEDPTKKLWDWLQLLVIPVALGIGAFLLNKQQREREQKATQEARKQELEIAQEERKNDREIAADRAKEDAFQRYLDRMSELMLDKNLHHPQLGRQARSVARSRTLAVLRNLEGDGSRRGQVIQFLYESDLIGGLDDATKLQRVEAIINLSGADIMEADLTAAYLSGANLSGVQLQRAKLELANLSMASLSVTNLTDAYLNVTNLSGANLSITDLSNARLSQSNLKGTNLREA